MPGKTKVGVLYIFLKKKEFLLKGKRQIYKGYRQGKGYNLGSDLLSHPGISGPHRR